jgi:hypothetical protein
VQGGTVARFGCAVAMTEHMIVVSACGDSSVVTMGGAVYIYQFVKTNGDEKDDDLTIAAPAYSVVLSSLLAPGDLQANAQFGHILAVSGNRIVVAAYEEVTTMEWIAQRTVLYVYGLIDTTVDTSSQQVTSVSSNKWILLAKIRSPSADPHDLFGASMALYHSEVLIVGAPGAHDGRGVIHVYGSFNRATDTSKCETVDTTTAGVETVSAGVSLDEAGSTCIGEEWRFLMNLTSHEAEEEAMFGSALGVFGDSLLVAAGGGSGSVAHSGVVFVEWNMLSAITAYFATANGDVDTVTPENLLVYMNMNAIIIAAFGSAAAVALIMYIGTLRMGCYKDKQLGNSSKNGCDEECVVVETGHNFISDRLGAVVLKDIRTGQFSRAQDSDDDDDYINDKDDLEHLDVEGDMDLASDESEFGTHNSHGSRTSRESAMSRDSGSTIGSTSVASSGSTAGTNSRPVAVVGPIFGLNKPSKSCAVRTTIDKPQQQLAMERGLFMKYRSAKANKHMALRTDDSIHDVAELAGSVMANTTSMDIESGIAAGVSNSEGSPSILSAVASLFGFQKQSPAPVDDDETPHKNTAVVNPITATLDIPDSVLFNSKQHYRSNTCNARFISDSAAVDSASSGISSGKFNSSSISLSNAVSGSAHSSKASKTPTPSIRELLVARPARPLLARTHATKSSVVTGQTGSDGCVNTSEHPAPSPVTLYADTTTEVTHESVSI